METVIVKKTLRQILLEYYGPKALTMQREQRTKELLEMRLEICRAVAAEYATSDKYHVIDVDRAMMLVWPGIRSKPSGGCGNCAAANVNKLKAEVRNLEAALDKLNGTEQMEEKPVIEQPINPAHTGAIAGSYTYAVLVTDGKPMIHLGMAMNGAAHGSQRMMSFITSKEIDVPLELIHPNAQSAHRAWKAMVLAMQSQPSEPETQPSEQEPKQDAAPEAIVAEQSQPPVSDPPKDETPVVTKPAGIRTGTVLTNGEIEAKVLSIEEGHYKAVTKENGADIEIEIKFESIGREWSRLPPK